MDRQITKRMEEIYELRAIKRWSFAKIASALGVSRQAIHDSYRRALGYVEEYKEQNRLPEGMTLQDMYRAEELEYIEGVLERYMRYADANEDKKTRTSIEALNGAHRYLDSLIKIKGINAPLKIEHRVITDEDIDKEIVKIRSEIAEIENTADAEIVSHEQD